MANSRNFTTQGLALYDRARNAFSNLNQNLQQPNPYGGIGGAEGLTRVGLSMMGAAPQGLSAALAAAGETKSGIADYNRTLQQAEQDRLLRLQLANMDNIARENVAMINQSGRAGSYRPDLTTYKNTSNSPVNINGIILQPNEERPFNVSDPNVANAIMNTQGIEEVFRDRRTRSLEMYRTSDGKFYKSFLDSDNNLYYEGEDGIIYGADNFFEQFPDAVTTTAGQPARYQMDNKEFRKLKSEIRENEKSMWKFEKYIGNVKDKNVGYQVLVDQLDTWFRTLAGRQDLSPEGLARSWAEGQLQGLVGANRIDTVGGGVMTEKDAWRIIKRLGGEVDMLQNPAVVIPLLKEMYEEKVYDYNGLIEDFNRAAETGNHGNYELKTRIEPDYIDRTFSLAPKNVPYLAQPRTVKGRTIWYDEAGKKFYDDKGTQITGTPKGFESLWQQ